MAKFKVNEGFEVTLGDVVYKAGEILDIDETLADVQTLVTNGNIALVVDEPVALVVEENKTVEENKEETVTADEVIPSDEPRKRFKGQIVVVDGYRTLRDGNEVRHVSVADGSEYDLTELEYNTQVKVSYPPTA